MAEALHELHQGTYVDPSSERLSDYLDGWLKGERERLSAGAYDACELHVRAYIKPRLGSVKLRDLTRPRIRTFYSELRASGRGNQPLAAKTVYNVHRTLSRALSDAVEDRLLARNPAAKGYSQPPSPEQDIWTAEQLRTFLAYVAEHDRLYALWRLATTTGLRRGRAGRPALAARRPQGERGVDRPAAGQGQRHGRGRAHQVAQVPPPPGGGRGDRRGLREHRKRQDAERREWGEAYTDHGLVFCLEDGTPLHPDTVTSRLRNRAEKLGLPWIKLHGLRHSYATLLLQAGVHPKVVQERLGHASITETLDTYSHVVPSLQREAADLGAALIDAPDDAQDEDPEQAVAESREDPKPDPQDEAGDDKEQQ